MWLTYGLYLLRHNAEIQSRLLHRSRASDPGQIFGAIQEVIFAGAMIRAGFELEFEDEADGTDTHCEFTATSKFTGKKFSVEVKVCNPGDCNGKEARRTFRQPVGALSKSARHERTVVGGGQSIRSSETFRRLKGKFHSNRITRKLPLGGPSQSELKKSELKRSVGFDLPSPIAVNCRRNGHNSGLRLKNLCPASGSLTGVFETGLK